MDTHTSSGLPDYTQSKVLLVSFVLYCLGWLASGGTRTRDVGEVGTWFDSPVLRCGGKLDEEFALLFRELPLFGGLRELTLDKLGGRDAGVCTGVRSMEGVTGY